MHPKTNKTAPLVSVIIPTYNRADLLRLTVESVLAQTYPNVEVIVVDDGSHDHTAQVMAMFSDQITYIRQDNQGTDAAYAMGYSMASGMYINFLDHDDLMMPSKLAQQVRYLAEHPEISLVHCGYHHMDERGEIIQRAFALPDKNPIDELLAANFIWSGAPLIRRECLDTVGLFDESIACSDWDLWLRIALAGYRFHCVQQPLGAYRILPQSAMTNLTDLEAGITTTLAKAFEHPNLPISLRKRRTQIYGRMYFEIAVRHYNADDIENGRRCLSIYADSFTDELSDGDRIMERVINEVIKSPRVHDAVAVVELLLANLPANGVALKKHAHRILAGAHVASSLKDYCRIEFDSAQHQMETAVRLYPQMLQAPDDYTYLLTNSAYSLPVADPFRFAAQVTENLPEHAKALERFKSQIDGDLHIIAAFQAYASKQWQKVPGHVMRGAFRQPTCLRNRGVYAITFKSLQQLLMERRLMRPRTGRLLDRNKKTGFA